MSNDTTGTQFDAFRRICLPMILAVGLFTPSLIIFLLEITLGDIPPLESLRDIAHRQFAEGHNLFLLAVIGLIPFGVLAVVLRALSNKLMGLHLAIFAICGLAGILTLMIPAHVSLWRPLYTDEHASSTAVIAFLFIPFYCIMSMGAGIIVASIIFIPRWIREAKKNNP